MFRGHAQRLNIILPDLRVLANGLYLPQGVNTVSQNAKIWEDDVQMESQKAKIWEDDHDVQVSQKAKIWEDDVMRRSGRMMSCEDRQPEREDLGG